jgi:hypothetical protein
MNVFLYGHLDSKNDTIIPKLYNTRTLEYYKGKFHILTVKFAENVLCGKHLENKST